MFDRRIHMDDQNIIKIVNATCVLHNYLCTARMDVANVMGRLNPDGAPYFQCYMSYRTKDITQQMLHKESDESIRTTLTQKLGQFPGREI